MKKNFKKWTALFLSVAMVAVSGVTTNTSFHAAEDTGVQESAADSDTETGTAADATSATSATSATGENGTEATQEVALTQDGTDETAGADNAAATSAASSSSMSDSSETASSDSEATEEVTSSSNSDENKEQVKSEQEQIDDALKDATKRSYHYEDSNITVNAELEDPTAIPDEAEFKVTQITSDTAGYNYDAYMEALNEKATPETDTDGATLISEDMDDSSATGEGKKAYTSENTLLYDMAFIYNVDVQKEDGTVSQKKIELQPADGTVKISVVFHQNQLTDKIDASENQDVDIKHLPLNDNVKADTDTTKGATGITASDVNVEDVNDVEVSVNDQKAEFNTDSFSAYAFTNNGGEVSITPGSSQSAISVLGDAINYGIVADTLTQNVHMDSNFAAKAYDNGGYNFTLGAYTNSNNPGQILVATITNKMKITSQGTVILRTPEENISKITEGKDHAVVVGTASNEVESTIKNMMKHVETVGSNMLNETTYSLRIKDTNDFNNNDKSTIDFTKYEKGTYYLDGDSFFNVNVNDINIKKNDDQIIVFNFSETSPTFKKFKVNGIESTTSSQDAEKYAKTIIFNMPNATSVSWQGGIFGIVLAPKATINAFGGTSTGWLVAKIVTVSHGEWHCVYQNMPKYDVTTNYSFSATKLVNSQNPGKKRFTFTLEKKTGDSWETVQTVNNGGDEGKTVAFGALTAAYDENRKGAENVIYRISEPETQTVDNITYSPSDGTNEYFAKVAIENTVHYENNSKITGADVKILGYYKDEACTNKKIEGTPVFNNTKQDEDKTDIKVTKKWEDNDNQDGKRPNSVTVQLLADGKAQGDSITLNSGNNWTYTWTELAKYKAGNEIVYSVEETSKLPDGYASEVSGSAAEGFTITNSYTPETTGVSGTKTWNDNNNQDGKRPKSITVNLLANGNKVESKTVTADADGKWAYSFTGLSKYADGNLIVYTVTEGQVDNYSTTINNYDITNSYTPEKTSITVTKSWDDSNNQDGKRPNSVKVQLLADGKAQGEPIILNSDNKWTHTWTELAKYKAGNEIVYSVEETSKLPDGYASEVSGSAAEGFTITNSYTPETTGVSGTKTWNDNNNQDGKRPKSITVNLLANGNKVESKTVTADADGKWAYSFTGLPKYADGNLIVYTVTEGQVDNYSTTINNYDITNSYTPEKTSITVTKSWDDSNNQDGKRPNSVKVQLLADGKAQGEPIILNSDNKWTHTWTELAKYKAGNEIVYSVEETSKLPDGYASEVSGSAAEGFTITNSYTPETTGVSGTKTWNDNNNQDGKRPKSITVNLLANGNKVESKTVTADADGKWAYSFTGLPKYADGNLIVYTVTEGQVDNYSTTINNYDITNSYTPEKTSITVTKSWDDSNNQDGKRPNSVKVQLLADGKAQGEPIILNSDNKWTHTWTELAKYKAGNEIVYSVEETSKLPDGYASEVSGSAAEGFTITNSYTPETTGVSGTKTWNDNNNQDGKRPKSITVNLLANGNKVESKTVTADADGKWAYSFTGLPKYADGNLIVYTVTEGQVDNYSTTINNYDITNSYTPEKTSITVTKSWDDSNNQDGKRPNSVKVQLLADGKAQGEPIILNSDNKWTHTWTELAKYKAGNEIVYSVEETSKLPDGYASEVSGSAAEGFTITNSYTPETTGVSGTKTWNDNNNQDGKRPKSITVNLLANGNKVESKTVTADADGKWAYSFTGLPKYADGNLIVYTVTEGQVDNYSTTINNYDITNSYTPEKTSITVTKSWDDSNNQDGKRPNSVKVQLLADGKAQGEPIILNSDNKWTHTWTELAKYKAGNEIVYSVEETSKLPDGYASEVSGSAAEGFTITNSYTPETTGVSGTKTWNDNNNQDGKRPKSITVNLLANGNKVESKTVTADADGKWAYSFTGLPKYADGNLIVYTVTEGQVDNYSTTINNYDITNSYTPEKTSITVTKSWDDSNNQDGKRPNSVKVQLLADGKAQGEPIILNSDNKWTHTWTELAKYKAGNEIVYSVEETSKLPNGYTSEVSGSAAEGFTITNSYIPETTGVSGTKTWDDQNDQDGKRPKSITVNLLANGNKVESKTVKADTDGNWTYNFDDLPKYAEGKEITYTITEDAVTDYSTKVDGYNVTNTYKPGKTSISVTKVWDDNNNQENKRPSDITVQLYADETAVDGKTLVLNDSNKWSGSFDNLDAKKDGKDIAYTVKETDVPDGYVSSVSGDQTQGYTITNTFNEKSVLIKGNKQLTNGAIKDFAGKFRFELIENNRVIDTATNDRDGDFSFGRLTFGSNDVGVHTYTVREQNKGKVVDNIKYDDTSRTVTIDVTKDADGVISVTTDGNDFSFTNTQLASLTVNKTWNDNDNADGNRPDSVHVSILKDGEVVRQGDLSETTGWSMTFEGLEPGESYTVEESFDSEYYKAEQNDITVDLNGTDNEVTLVNDYIHPTVDIVANKVLVGGKLQSGQFTFQLYRNSDPNTVVATRVNDASGQIVFNDIEYDEAGYTVREVTGTDTHITYDTGAVTYDADGNVTGSHTEFTNTERPIVLRVQKRSKTAPYDPLEGATYGLYQVVEGGNDILVESEVSDENGYMYYSNIQPGVIYYFKEIAAPTGHEVDPYAGQKFQIKYTNDGQIALYDVDGNPTTLGDITSQNSNELLVQHTAAKSTIDTTSALSYSDDTIVAAAKAVNGAFDEGTTLKVTQLTGSAAKSAAAAVEDATGEIKNNVAYYDVQFIDKDGNEVEPKAGDVTVTIQYKDSLSLPEGTDASALKLVHITDGNAVEAVAGSIAAGNGKLLEAKITSDSFSTFGVVEPGKSNTLGSNYLVTAAGVSDQVSELNISKLDTAGKYVKGARLQIIEKATGKVVAEWNTSDGPMSFARWFDGAGTEPMNVDTYYILHEVSAPDGYQLADDIMFIINKYDSSITVYKYDDAGNLVVDQEAVDQWVSDTTLSMVDVPVEYRNKVRYVQKTIHNEKTIQGDNKVVEVTSVRAVKTGDTTPIALFVIMLAAAAVVLMVLAYRKNKQDNQ